MTIVEGFAMGLPVIASNLGAMSSLIEHGRTGLHFVSGDSADLAAQVQYLKHHPEQAAYMGRQARLEFESKYTSEHNYRQLISIYNRVRRVQSQTCVEHGVCQL